MIYSKNKMLDLIKEYHKKNKNFPSVGKLSEMMDVTHMSITARLRDLTRDGDLETTRVKGHTKILALKKGEINWLTVPILKKSVRIY